MHSGSDLNSGHYVSYYRSASGLKSYSNDSFSLQINDWHQDNKFERSILLVYTKCDALNTNFDPKCKTPVNATL